MVKSQKKRRAFKKAQKIIQNAYMCVFISWAYVLAFVAKFSTFEEVKPIVIVVAITGALTIAKGIYYCRTKEHRQQVWREIKQSLRSEQDFRF